MPGAPGAPSAPAGPAGPVGPSAPAGPKIAQEIAVSFCLQSSGPSTIRIFFFLAQAWMVSALAVLSAAPEASPLY